MVDDLQIKVYFGLIVFFGVASAILGLLIFLSRKNVWMKISSFMARKQGKILVKYKDENKGSHEEYAFVKERTITVHPPWLEGAGMIIGIDPLHIYHDSMYSIRSIDCNARGSYYVTGNERIQDVSQAYLDGVLADKMVKRALATRPTGTSIDKKIMILLVIVAVAAVGALAAAYFAYMNNQILAGIMANGGTIAASAGGIL